MDGRPRVLHVLGSLHWGGIETWLMHIVRHQHRFDVRHELLLTETRTGAYEGEARRLGIPIHKIPLRNGRVAWFGKFSRFLREDGPFLAVHAHDDPPFTALLLTTAKRAGVPIRIAHSHSARSRGEDYPLSRRLLRLAAIPLAKAVATRLVGISEDALAEIAGAHWRSRDRASLLFYGFDFGRFRGAAERGTALRRRLALPPNARIVGNVARFSPVKNHDLLLRAFAICRGQCPDAHLVLVGAGPLQEALESLADTLGIRSSVLFAGTSDDVPAFMAMFDLFVLPSFSEGLGIVCIEAQAAGTRLLVSDTTPAEALVVPGASETLDPGAPAPIWGAAMARLVGMPPPEAAPEAWLDELERGRFGLDRCIAELAALYLPHPPERASAIARRRP
ncbi:glycosyltransferase [Sphingosinicella sp. BN140058]|uniref:glycosyltransferase n=1 Tax=Sphingosinicella sp. BN140058 TaxID=1892855 RepID=UPI0010119878|nr:glycosyltransferase [Sphingosinicella sp. BN140058]QAY78467.1 glycosyltransferase [Sphingosinicella sp. BN140058]